LGGAPGECRAELPRAEKVKTIIQLKALDTETDKRKLTSLMISSCLLIKVEMLCWLFTPLGVLASAVLLDGLLHRLLHTLPPTITRRRTPAESAR
jgi:hypothetical protein